MVCALNKIIFRSAKGGKMLANLSNGGSSRWSLSEVKEGSSTLWKGTVVHVCTYAASNQSLCFVGVT